MALIPHGHPLHLLALGNCEPLSEAGKQFVGDAARGEASTLCLNKEFLGTEKIAGIGSLCPSLL